MTKPIDLYLISGFLGSGKTTFLRSMLNAMAGKELGVLINEFGRIGIDGDLIRKDEIKLVEINNGSIFCACLKDGFARTLRKFSQLPICALLIENSGLADPSAMNTIIENLKPYLERQYNYLGSICLADCSTLDDYLEVLTPVQNQLSSADFIILNKTDLIDQQNLERLKRNIRSLNNVAKIHETVYAHVPEELLDEYLTNHGYRGIGSNTPYNRPLSCTIEAGGFFDRERIEAFLRELGDEITRVKGFIRSAEGWLHVDGVGGNFQISLVEHEMDEATLPRNRLVFISCKENASLNLIEKNWKKHCSEHCELTGFE